MLFVHLNLIFSNQYVVGNYAAVLHWHRGFNDYYQNISKGSRKKTHTQNQNNKNYIQYVSNQLVLTRLKPKHV